MDIWLSSLLGRRDNRWQGPSAGTATGVSQKQGRGQCGWVEWARRKMSSDR